MDKSTAHRLTDWRDQIDKLDFQLLQILAERRKIVLEIGDYKKEQGLPPLDTQRWEQVLQSKISLAKDLDISPEFIRDLYNLIHEYSLELEQ